MWEGGGGGENSRSSPWLGQAPEPEENTETGLGCLPRPPMCAQSLERD